MLKEIWKDVVGYEGSYQVSNLGRVKRVGGGSDGRFLPERVLNQRINEGRNYYTVMLTYNNVSKTKYVHRIVCESFCGNPPSKKHQVNHIDGNKENNKSNNLEWVTAKGNMAHYWNISGNSQNGEENPANKYPESLMKQIINLYKTTNLKQREIAKITGLDYRYVNTIIHGRAWKHLER